MLQLALDIAAWLCAAALLGFGVAWLLRGVDIEELKAQVQRLETDLGLREHELGMARSGSGRLGGPASIAAEPLPGSGVRASDALRPSATVRADPDDLKRIRGVGPVLERRLNELGVRQFRQVALWTDADIDFFDRELRNFHGRIRRENWVHSATEEHFKKYGEWLAADVTAASATARH